MKQRTLTISKNGKTPDPKKVAEQFRHDNEEVASIKVNPHTLQIDITYNVIRESEEDKTSD